MFSAIENSHVLRRKRIGLQSGVFFHWHLNEVRDIYRAASEAVIHAHFTQHSQYFR